MAPIRLVTFDALQTILQPRLPIYVQYSQTFAPYLGVLEPDLLQKAFKTSLKSLQSEKPAYQGKDGARGWWSEVIRKTAIGAGAGPKAVDRSLPDIVPRLMARFSSKEGYKLFDDTIPVLRELKGLNIQTALVSNTDSRMHAVLHDLEIASYFYPVILSEEVGIEKPSSEIFLRACAAAKFVKPEECVHVGDELYSDYHGASKAGVHALLLRRPGPDGEGEQKEEGEDLTGIKVIRGLREVVEWTR